MIFDNELATKNVLIVHGWMHSADRYKSLAKMLPNCRVNIVDLPGFGNCNYRGDAKKAEENHICFLKKILTNQKYDFVIAHSWGASVLLKVVPLLEADKKPDVILMNPAYGENKKLKLLLPFQKITEIILTAQKILPLWLVKYPVKLSALLTINHWSLIDDDIVHDARRSDPHVAANLLSVMACDKWTVTDKTAYGKSYLIFSEQDRIIERQNMEDLNSALQPVLFEMFYGVGHTLVIENFNELSALLERIIGGTEDENISKVL